MGDQNDQTLRTASGGITIVHGSANVRPGIALVFKNNELIYDGAAHAAPKEMMELPGILVIMHPHLKAQLDAAEKKRQQVERLQRKHAERLN